MKKSLLALLLLLSCALSGCAAAAESGAFTVITTNFPQYDFARTVAGERAEVIMLLPPGTESHSYEPRPSDIVAITEADLFIYTGAELEPWAGRLLEGISSDSLTVADISQGIELEPSHEDDGHDHDHPRWDPHIWLDPQRAASMCANIAAALTDKDPGGAQHYAANLQSLTKELEALDADISAAVDAGSGRTLVFAGRMALAYFLERYGLSHIGVMDTCAGEAGPAVADIIRVVEYIEANGVGVIYYEELAEPVTANSIAQQTGAQPLLFHSCHNVSKDEFAAGVTYIDLMRQNLDNLVEGLK